MSNSYGFDFLQSQYRDASDSIPAAPKPLSAATSSAFLAAQHKPDLEKQADVLAFLKAYRGSGCLAPSVILKSTGVDLTDRDIKVAENLQRNPKVRVEMVPDPENPNIMSATYAYQAKYSSVKDKATLLAQINRMVNGVKASDLMDSYNNVNKDLQALITSGEIIATMNTEDRDRILFPRGEAFLVELDGVVSLQPSQYDSGVYSTTQVQIDIDPRRQIRRGEAIQVGGQWFRVSTSIREGYDQPQRAQAPLSVVSTKDPPQRNELDGYSRSFTSKTIPLDDPLSDVAKQNLTASKTARERLLKLAHGRTGGAAGQLLSSQAHASNPAQLASSYAVKTKKRPTTSPTASASATNAAGDVNIGLYSHARRHGCTKDVRDMYLQTRSWVPASDEELRELLVTNGLLDKDEMMRGPRLKRTSNLDNDGKPKKKRYYVRKNQQMTNTHLDGTAVGAALAMAVEKLQQGKTAGDGGM